VSNGCALGAMDAEWRRRRRSLCALVASLLPIDPVCSLFSPVLRQVSSVSPVSMGCALVAGVIVLRRRGVRAASTRVGVRLLACYWLLSGFKRQCPSFRSRVRLFSPVIRQVSGALLVSVGCGLVAGVTVVRWWGERASCC